MRTTITSLHVCLFMHQKTNIPSHKCVITSECWVLHQISGVHGIVREPYNWLRSTSRNDWRSWYTSFFSQSLVKRKLSFEFSGVSQFILVGGSETWHASSPLSSHVISCSFFFPVKSMISCWPDATRFLFVCFCLFLSPFFSFFGRPTFPLGLGKNWILKDFFSSFE